MLNPSILKTAAVETVRDAARACYELFKVLIPVMIAVKILVELDLIKYLAVPLAPFMDLVGLPSEMGLVWATAMVNSIYAGIVVLLSLVGDTPLTAAQATILGTMMLVAHSLPVELQIARKCGARLIFQAAFRLGGALLIGILLHRVYAMTGLLSGPADILMAPAAPVHPSLGSWALGEVRNLLSIFCIVLVLMAAMRILAALGVINLLNRMLNPVLTLLGIGPEASALTVIGLTLGISYGGGLIINKAQSGEVDKTDVFFSFSLMGLAHSLIEDTMLIALIGGHLSGILFGRTLFALIMVGLLVRLTRLLPFDFCAKYLWSDPR